MKLVYFTHSLRSDWNHGNAHFLRGVATELMGRGCDVTLYEPANAWSVRNLVAEYGPAAPEAYRSVYPQLRATLYDPAQPNLPALLRDAAVVIVHEWNDHALVAAIGEYRARHAHFLLLFHDTHHRSVTDPAGMAAYDLRHYDGVLAYGESIRQVYLREGWTQRAWTWHEAADTRVFRPRPETAKIGDLVWIGNWGDDERTAELHEFLIEPVKRLKLKATVYGVRYPDSAIQALAGAGIAYGGWLPNFQAPEVFAQYRLTVHVPRRPYAQRLPGIPTIRPFEALACGIPLVSAPWQDTESLFRKGQDFLSARDGGEMCYWLARLLHEPDLARCHSRCGLQTIRERHTCAHRVDELLAVCAGFGVHPVPAVTEGAA